MCFVVSSGVVLHTNISGGIFTLQLAMYGAAGEERRDAIDRVTFLQGQFTRERLRSLNRSHKSSGRCSQIKVIVSSWERLQGNT